VSVIFVLWRICRKYFEKKNTLSKNSLKFSTVAYNIKEYLKFPSFIFWILPNLAKYTSGRLPIKQHHKIEKRKQGPAQVLIHPGQRKLAAKLGENRTSFLNATR
jgi:hypothetical protein